MKAEAKLVRELFEGEQCLVVPVFQRPYVWTRTKNWEPLWADIVAMADTLSRNPSAEPHFLGAVVLDSTEKDSADISVLQVIDGQQRITTLQIALCAVRDAFETAGLPRKFASAINKLTVNEDQLSIEKFAPYKVWPTLRDREAFTAIVDHTDTGDGDDSRLRDAYEYFFDETLAWLGEAESDHARVKSLVDALRTGLQLVSIELTGNDNAQVIFESLNDRGTPLLPSDLVKNSLFQLLERAGVDVEQAFDDHWRRLETTFWQEDVRQGRIIRSRLDAFFGHYLTMRTGEEVTTTGLFNRFKRLTSTMGRDELLDVLADIAECSETYRTIVDRTGVDVHDRLLETADALDTTVLAPVVLYLDRNSQVDDRVEAFGYIESWLVRRAVLRSTSKNYNRMLLDLLRLLQRSEAPYGPTIRAFFEDNGSESGRWPTDAEIREALVSSPIFKNLTRTRVQLVLNGCERGLAPARDAKSDLVYALLATAADDVDDANRASLGNLTLVPSTLSRQLAKAQDWEARRRILESTDLQLNRSLPEALSDVPISVRGSELATGFIRTWPHPGSEISRSDLPDADRRDAAEDGESDRSRGVWSEIQGFFTGLPVGSVSRLEDRIETVETGDGLSLEMLTQSVVDGFAIREIAGTLYIEKVRSESEESDDNVSETPSPVQPQVDDQQSKARTRAVHNESISDLMRAGLIAEGDRVYHEQPRKGTSFAARITRAGQLLTGGRHYASPSTALSDLTGSSRNGWRDWRLERTGETLEQIRERFRRERESAE